MTRKSILRLRRIYRRNKTKTALSGKYSSKQRQFNATVSANNRIEIDGATFPAVNTGDMVAGTKLSVVNISQPSNALFSPANIGGTAVIRGGIGSSGGGDIPADHKHNHADLLGNNIVGAGDHDGWYPNLQAGKTPVILADWTFNTGAGKPPFSLHTNNRWREVVGLLASAVDKTLGDDGSISIDDPSLGHQTTNPSLGVNKAHTFVWTGQHTFNGYDVKMGANLDFTASNPQIKGGTGNLTILTGNQIRLVPSGNPDGARVVLPEPVGIGSDPYTFHAQGWNIDSRGAADFRNIFANEMHVEVFVADENLVLQSLLTVAKSSGTLADEFVVPSKTEPDNTAWLTVNNSPNLTGAIFQDGDTVMLYLAQWGEAGDPLVLSAAYGVVSQYGPIADTDAQQWLFTRMGGYNGGDMSQWTRLPVGSAVIDWGKDGDGIYEISAVTNVTGDGFPLERTNYGPYARTLTWSGSPYRSELSSIQGQLQSVTGVHEFGIWGGYEDNVAEMASYFKASNNGIILQNGAIDIYSRDANNDVQRRISLQPDGSVKFGTNVDDDNYTGFMFVPGDIVEGTAPTLRVGRPNSNMSWLPAGLVGGEQRDDRLAIVGAGAKEVIYFENDGDSYFSGVMQIALGGEIRQGVGDIDLPMYDPGAFTGLRIFRLAYSADGTEAIGTLKGMHNNSPLWETDGYGRFRFGNVYYAAYRSDLDWSATVPDGDIFSPIQTQGYRPAVVMGKRGVSIMAQPDYMQEFQPGGSAPQLYDLPFAQEFPGLSFFADTLLAYEKDDWGASQVNPVAKIFTQTWGQTYPFYPEREPSYHQGHGALRLVGPGSFESDVWKNAQADLSLLETSDIKAPPYLDIGYWPGGPYNGRYARLQNVESFTVHTNDYVYITADTSQFRLRASGYSSLYSTNLEITGLAAYESISNGGSEKDARSAAASALNPTLDITGWLQTTGDIRPSVSAAEGPSGGYNLGNSGLYWNTLYVRRIVGTEVIEGEGTWLTERIETPANLHIVSTDMNTLRAVFIERSDGGRMDLHVNGSIAVDGEVDGVDISSFYGGYTAHIGNENAHHARTHDLDGPDHTGSFPAEKIDWTDMDWGGVTGIRHSGLDGLDANDHPHYARHAVDEDITGDWTFGTNGAPFAIAAGAQGQKVVGLRAETAVSVSKNVIAGLGLTGGGWLTDDVTLSVGSGHGISISQDVVSVRQADSFDWTGLHTFNPQGPPFAIGERGKGIVVEGLKADMVSKSVIAGEGLTGGGKLTADRTIDIGGGNGLVVGANSIAVGEGDGVSVGNNDVAVNASVARDTWPLYAGNGLTGGGNLSPAGTSFGVGAGEGVYVTASDVNVDSSVARDTWPVHAGFGLAGGGNLSLEGPVFNVDEAESFVWTGNHTFMGGFRIASNILPDQPDTYDIGSATNPWRQAFISQINSVVFAEYQGFVNAGLFIIPIRAGTMAHVQSDATTIDFRQNMYTDEMVLIKATDAAGIVKTEYIRIIGTETGPIQEVERDVADAHAGVIPAWAAGTVFTVLGVEGDGRIELDATQQPQISVKLQGTGVDNAEVLRLGDLNGTLDISVPTYGQIAGNDVFLTPTTGFSGFAVDNLSGMRLYNASLDLYTGGVQTVQILPTGDVKFGSDLSQVNTTGFFFDASRNDLYIGDQTSTYLKWNNSNNRLMIYNEADIVFRVTEVGDVDIGLVTGYGFDHPTNPSVGIKYEAIDGTFGLGNVDLEMWNEGVQTGLWSRDGSFKTGLNIANNPGTGFEFVSSDGDLYIGNRDDTYMRWYNSLGRFLFYGDGELRLRITEDGSVDIGEITGYDFSHPTLGGSGIRYDGPDNIFKIGNSSIEMWDSGTNTGLWDSSGGMKLGRNVANVSGTSFELDVDDGDIWIGRRDKGHLWWNQEDERIYLRDGDGDVNRGYIDTDGSMVFGDGDVVLDDDGLSLEFGLNSTIAGKIAWYEDVSTKQKEYFVIDGWWNGTYNLAQVDIAGIEKSRISIRANGEDQAFGAVVAIMGDTASIELYSEYVYCQGNFGINVGVPTVPFHVNGKGIVSDELDIGAARTFVTGNMSSGSMSSFTPVQPVGLMLLFCDANIGTGARRNATAMIAYSATDTPSAYILWQPDDRVAVETVTGTDNPDKVVVVAAWNGTIYIENNLAFSHNAGVILFS